ncbi:MAG: SUMF1/EgtB/PvdO family nonheme iron enzyme [Blastocatellales bacterium]
MPTEPNPSKVFISYSHDSEEHVTRVLRLSDALCHWGIDCHIDQYELAPANWLSWMERQIKEADFVLIVCTEVYCRRFEQRETRPSGVGWEGGVITTELYERQQDKAAKFIPIVFSAEDNQHIPTLLRPTHRHFINIEKLDVKHPGADVGTENLYRHLAGMPRVVKPKLGPKIMLPPINVQEEIAEDVEGINLKEMMPGLSAVKLGNELTLPKRESDSPPKIQIATPIPASDHRNFTEDLGKGVKLEMIAIPGGSFLMGSEDFKITKPVHPVRLSPFHIGKYQVTQRQWQAVMGDNPSHFKGDNQPVERVSWEMAVEFCEKLSKQTGKNYRLPTEAEWEYACLAGSTGKYCFGDDESLLKDYAWFGEGWQKGGTHPVGQKKPNNWGLYDMHGNVWEWCQDWYDENYYAELGKQGEAVNPQGPNNGQYRVLRGGSWINLLDYARAVYRNGTHPADRNSPFGFRLVSCRPPSSS